MRTITALINHLREEEPVAVQAPQAPWMRDVDYAVQDVDASKRVALALAGMHDQLKAKAESLRSGAGERVEVAKFIKGLRGVEAKVASAHDALRELLVLLDEPVPEPVVDEGDATPMAPMRAGRMG